MCTDCAERATVQENNAQKNNYENWQKKEVMPDVPPRHLLLLLVVCYELVSSSSLLLRLASSSR